MGIKHLNTFLLNNCSKESINRTSLITFKCKTLVIDTSIYIYQYLSEDSLFDSFYNMLSVFKQYEITPIFIFDGKPPSEKSSILWERYYKRKDAESKYKEIIEKIQSQSDTTDLEKEKEIEKFTSLKRQFIRVTDDVIQKLKQLFSNFQVQYIDALQEADQLCAYMVKHNLAYGCISDDMDLFAYDCPIVIRKLNLQYHNCIMYNTNKIKQELFISDFTSILTLCGTDYSKSITWDIATVLKRYYFYEDEKNRNQTNQSFYPWLNDHAFLTKEELDEIYHVYDMFQLPISMTYEIANSKQYNWGPIQPILESHGFIFVD